MVKKILGVAVTLIVVAVLLFAAFFIRPDYTLEDVADYAAPPSAFMELPDGAKAHYRDQGNQDGMPIILIHGSNSSLHTWEPWAEELGDTYRIITVDMPGHGLTGAVPGDDYSRAGMVRFLDEVVSRLDLTRFALGGNSMGGGVSLAYALDHPEKVSHLVLVSSGGFPPAGTRDAPIAFRMASTPVLRDIMPYMSSRSMVEEGLRNVIADDSLVTEEMVDRYAAMNRYQGNRAAMVQRFAGYGAGQEYVHERLGEIGVPVLVLWGAQDFLIPVEIARKFDAGLSDSTLVIYEEAGHIAMEEVPEKSAGDVRAFLAAH